MSRDTARGYDDILARALSSRESNASRDRRVPTNVVCRAGLSMAEDERLRRGEVANRAPEQEAIVAIGALPRRIAERLAASDFRMQRRDPAFSASFSPRGPRSGCSRAWPCAWRRRSGAEVVLDADPAGRVASLLGDALQPLVILGRRPGGLAGGLDQILERDHLDGRDLDDFLLRCRFALLLVRATHRADVAAVGQKHFLHCFTGSGFRRLVLLECVVAVGVGQTQLRIQEDTGMIM